MSYAEIQVHLAHPTRHRVKVPTPPPVCGDADAPSLERRDDWSSFFPTMTADAALVILEQTLAFAIARWRCSIAYDYVWLDHCALPLHEDARTVGRWINPAARSRRPAAPAGPRPDALLESGLQPLPDDDIPGTMRFDRETMSRVVFDGYEWKPIEKCHWERATPDELAEDTLALMRWGRGRPRAFDTMNPWAQGIEPPRKLPKDHVALYYFRVCVHSAAVAWAASSEHADAPDPDGHHQARGLRVAVPLILQCLALALGGPSAVDMDAWWANCCRALPVRNLAEFRFAQAS